MRSGPPPANPAATRWLDRFFLSYHRFRPVNATFIGEHAHDGRLPDCSESGLGDQLADAREQLAFAEALARSTSPTEALDVRLARGFLEHQIWELESAHFQRGNPSWYTGEAVFGVLSLLLNDFAPVEPRLESVVRRLDATPSFLAQGRTQVRSAPAEWTLRASRECLGALALLGNGIDWWCERCPALARPLRKAADRAAAAYEAHRVHLDTELLLADRPSGYTAGADALELYVRSGHFLARSSEEIASHAGRALEEAVAYLGAHARDFAASSPADALSALHDLHPSRSGYLAAYQETWDRVRAAAEEHDLLTWPDFAIRYVPRPEWVRSAAPHLYFLFYRSPASVGRPVVHDYLVTPIDADLPVAEACALLRANNQSVITLNHVIHHGSIGHHVQNWHAFRAESRVGRMAAVDCASRVAMFCGGTMAEGWACYATDLMDEIGFLTPLESYAEKQGRARMAARALVDVRLHQGRFTLEDAVRFYQRHAGMAESSARAEAVKNSMFPGGALMYLVGTDLIHELRRDLRGIRGAAFDLKAFHDRLLSFGSVPVALVARAMRSEASSSHDSPSDPGVRGS